MADQTNGAEPSNPDREFSRMDAAAFLTTIGYKMSAQRLATRAVEKKGPPFEKRGRDVFYKESVLLDWVRQERAAPNKGGRPTHRKKPQPAVDMIPPGTSRRVPSPLREMLSEHADLAERFADGTASAMDGFRFAQSVARLRKILS